MWFFSHQRLWLMTHLRGKLCRFISYNAQYVVFVLWHILYYNYNLTWSYGTKYICNMCCNLMSKRNFNMIYAIINTIYYILWWMKPQSLFHTCVMCHDLLSRKNHILLYCKLVLLSTFCLRGWGFFLGMPVWPTIWIFSFSSRH